MKQKASCRFKSNSGMARNILSQLSSEQTQDYLQFLKKKCNQAEDSRLKVFFINELTVLVEHQMLRKQLDMVMLKDVWFYILQQSSKQKVIKVMQKEWQAQKEEEEEEEEMEGEEKEEFSLNVEAFDNLREKIFDAFYSIL